MDHRGMTRKTIKGIIKRKVDDWISSIDDEAIQNAVKKEAIITGGCLPSMLLGEKVNDFDVYFQTKETVILIAKYYLGRFNPRKKEGIPVKMYVDSDDNTSRVRIIIKSAGIASEEGAEKEYQYFESRPEDEAEEYVEEIMQDPGEIQDALEKTKSRLSPDPAPEKEKYRPIFMSTNAITLSDKIQIVLRFYGSPDEIHKNYDFIHCTNYWTQAEGVVLRSEALECLLSKTLVYQGSRYPICSMFRVRKFIRRGWKINAGQILKMALQISKLDLTNPDVLEDQLTGVDVAYFAQLLNAAKAKDKTKIEQAYLVEIIDRMF